MSEDQHVLDQFASMDRYGFLSAFESNWETHRPLLFLALELTNRRVDIPFNVVEFGSGNGSTPYLRNYCSVNQRPFCSYDSNKEWAEKTGAAYVENWDSADIWNPCGVLFVDHAPGEHRKVALERMADRAEIIVVHDTELFSAGAYGFEPLWSKFKYVLHFNRTGGGAGATMVSNTIDLHKFRGLTLGGHQFEKKPKLGILIPTITPRLAFLKRLLEILDPQIEKYKEDVELFIEEDIRQKTIGEKRNILTQRAIDAGCTHRAFIDDDDTVTDDYLDLNMPGVYGDYDCNSLVGIYSLNGEINPNKHIFLHSLKYTHWYEDDKHYYRNPNHLNVVKLDRIKDLRFQEKNFGEDGCWSEDLAKAGTLKHEYTITKPFYNYLSRTKVDGI